MRVCSRILASGVLAILLCAQGALFPQARQSLALTRVAYNTRKATVKPQGELKEKIDAVDKELAEASRLGKTGEIRRLLAKGMALLAGREWDRNLEFTASLVLRAEEVCVDSSRPYPIRVEQIYSPRVELAASLRARIRLHKADRTAGLGEQVKEFAALETLGRDLLDEPARVELDLSGVTDGPYVLRVELFEQEAPIGSATLRVVIQQGLSQRMAGIAKGLESVRGFEALRSDVLYPLDYIHNVNRGRIALGNFDIAKELAAAETLLASIKDGKDPFDRRTGDMKRHYLLEGAGEIMPYRIYVPKSYRGDKDYPLIIALHGLGANEDSFFDAYGALLPKLAEQRDYLVAAPLGYRVDGGYGSGLLRATGDAAASRKAELSENDVMRVLDLMRKNYRVDPGRIYLMGHSMGAIGTWYLGAKYPEIWAAIAPFSGSGNPASVEKMKSIPQIVVHGDADVTVPVGGSRLMVEAMKRLDVVHQYIEVPGGDHINVVVPNLSAVLDFLDKQRKTSR
jgi:poly(3-hydroxybutyrate) depolymerase